MLTPITDRERVRAAFDRFAGTIKTGARKYHRSVGWHGGGGDFDVFWRPDWRFWAVFEDSLTDNRFWCAFGTTDATEPYGQTISCEINMPFEGVNRRIGGVFVRDDSGTVFVAHSGKIGGGRKGIGKELFWQMYRGAGPATVSYPDGAETELVLIGPVDGPQLVRQVGHFVHEVERIKAAAAGTTPAPAAPASRGRPDAPPPGYNPEFSGTRSPYPLRGAVEATCLHGPVVDALAKTLEARGRKIGNDRHRDLFVSDASGVTHVFEVKTDVEPASVYSAIGQLLFHSGDAAGKCHLVVVLPGRPSPATLRALERIGLSVLSYGWIGETVRFDNIDALPGIGGRAAG